MLLATHTVTTKSFTHNKQGRKFIAEMSDLGGITFLPLYDDACDVGLAMASTKTRNMSRWHVAEEQRDGEAEITAWILHPTPQTVTYFPALAGYQMIIFND